MRCVVLLFLLWTLVHGKFNSKAYTKYLMTASPEEILSVRNQAIRNDDDDEFEFSIPSLDSYCTVKIFPEEAENSGDEVRVTADVTCGGNTLYHLTQPVSRLSPVELDHNIQLFGETPDGGSAYLLITNGMRLELRESSIKNLPPLPGKNLTAAVVVNGGMVKFTDSEIEGNKHGTVAGGLYVMGVTQLDFEGGKISENKGDAGGVAVSGTSIVELEHCIVSGNEGETVGGIFVREQATFIGKELLLKKHKTGGQATGLFTSDRSTTFLVSSQFHGEEVDEEFVGCLLDPEKNEECESASEAGAVAVDSKAAATIVFSAFTRHSAKRGTILSSGTSSINVRRATFEKNAANIGGGIYVQGERGSSATMLDCKFHENVARFGGAMVVGGNGSFMIDSCSFKSNKALAGGAIWGDYTNIKTLVNGTCERTSAGSRVTILESNFVNNSAVVDGGAFFVKCTDIRANLSNFDENHAGRDGGAVYAKDTYDLDFIDCHFDNNKAEQNGGAILADNSHNIFSTRSNFTNSLAGIHGGAIASLTGSGIIMKNSKIVKNEASTGSGGAVYSDGVAEIDATETDLSKNLANSHGGALCVENSLSLSLKDVDLDGNKASGEGGAVKTKVGGLVHITDVIIDDIKSSSGVFSLQDMGEVRIYGFDFIQNQNTTECGGLSIDGAASVSLTDMVFSENKVNQHGGALCLSRAEKATLKNLKFIKNEAAVDGGALLLADSKEVVLKKVTFEANSAGFQGGALSGSNIESLLVSNVQFVSNKATLKGGAIYTKESSIELDKATFNFNYVGTKYTAFQNKTASIDNSVGPIQSSGVIYVASGDSFKSQDVSYEFNEAEDIGGMLMLVDMNEAYIRYDTFQNNSAALSGGCIHANNVRNLSIYDTTMKFCEAGYGGALTVGGISTFHGGYNFFENNKADSGGAFMCRGNSKIQMEATNFSYNSAPEGSTLSIDCICNVDLTESALYRDNQLPNNGDFFHTKKGCGEINSNGCEFYGGKEKDGGISWLWVVVAAAAFCGIVIIIIVFARRRRSNDDDEEVDLESGDHKDPLLAAGGKGRYQTVVATTSESEYTTTESESEEDSEESSSSYESEKSVEVIKPHKSKARGVEIEPEEETEPINQRTKEDLKKKKHRQTASLDMVNDGAGPSTGPMPAILPPRLVPVETENTQEENVSTIEAEQTTKQPTAPELDYED